MINLILSFNLLTSFQPLAQRQNFFQPGHDAFLLGKGREGYPNSIHILLIHFRLCCTRYIRSQ